MLFEYNMSQCCHVLKIIVKRTRFKKKRKKKTIYITKDRAWGECGEVCWGVEIGEGRGTGVWGKARGHEGCKEVWESVWG